MRSTGPTNLVEMCPDTKRNCLNQTYITMKYLNFNIFRLPLAFSACQHFNAIPIICNLDFFLKVFFKSRPAAHRAGLHGRA